MCERRLTTFDLEPSFSNGAQVIFERANNEKTLPMLKRSRYIVPQSNTVSQMVAIIR
jgi:hypothetical protein